MVILRGNFMRGTSAELQRRFVLIPWVKKSSFIIYSKGGKDYCSSVPVRYIPNKPSKTEELLLTSQPTKGSKDKEIDQSALRSEFSNSGKNLRRSFISEDKSQNKKPANNFIFDKISGVEEEIDHNYGAEDCESMELEIHQDKDSSKKLAVRVDKTKQDVELMAVEFLATRAFTAVQLKKKLIGKRCPHEIVNAVITDFQSRGLINDSLYAETYSRSRWSSSTWGPRRIKQSLFEKGVSKSDAEKAIQLVFDDSEDQENSRIGMSKESINHLYVQASKQWLRSRNVPIDKRKSRVIGWLQYRGFNWGVITYIIKKLESDNSD